MTRARSLHEIFEVLGWTMPDWMKDALCKEHPDVSWFPERGQSTKAATDICSACLVAPECRQHALTIPGVVGIWGGTSGRDRRTHHAQRTRATSAQEPAA